MKFIPTILSFLLCSILSVSVFAQAENEKTVSQKEFSFSYPADWRMLDKSREGVQQFNLMPPTGNVLIMLISYDAKIPTYDIFNQTRTQTSQAFADRLYDRFNQHGAAEGKDVCTKINNIDVPGSRVSGVYDKEKSTADLFYFAMNKKFFSLIYLREDKESEKSDVVWNNLLNSFTVKDFSAEKPDFIIDSGNDAVLNSKATKLGRPSWPSGVKLSSRVTVKVIIDENGKVISAKAVSGLQSFFPYAESAAKASKFKPGTICGKPTIITGFIVYTFDARN